MKLFMKICGMTRPEDAKFAEDEGADALGFVAYSKSPRFISPEDTARICYKLKGKIRKVGVFVNASPEFIIKYLDAGIDIVQLHGDENTDFTKLLPMGTEIWRAIKISNETDISICAPFPAKKFVIDSFSKEKYGGTGDTADWKLANLAVGILKKPVLLAGGIGPANIKAAFEAVHPAGFDVNSAVESAPGIKDHRLISECFRNIRKIS